MRSGFAAIVTCVVLACSGSRPPAATPAPPQPAAIDPPTVEFLLTSAATDFRAHQAAAGFREVHAGYITSPQGDKQYLLCGEFQPAHGTGEWMSFVTLKTSGYEQYVGAGSETWCHRPSFTGSREDLSSSLKSRFDAMP